MTTMTSLLTTYLYIITIFSLISILLIYRSDLSFLYFHCYSNLTVPIVYLYSYFIILIFSLLCYIHFINVNTFSLFICLYILLYIYIFIYLLFINNIYIIVYYLYICDLDHKTSLKSYISSNSQKYIVWVKIINFSFMPKNH